MVNGKEKFRDTTVARCLRTSFALSLVISTAIVSILSAWHADNESSMGFNPAIARISQPEVMSQIPNQSHRWQTNGLLAGTRQLASEALRLPVYSSALGS